jgi:hypothetical protein
MRLAVVAPVMVYVPPFPEMVRMGLVKLQPSPVPVPVLILMSPSARALMLHTAASRMAVMIFETDYIFLLILLICKQVETRCIASLQHSILRE